MQRLFAAVARVRCHNPFTSPGFKRTVSVAPSPKQERNNFIIAGGLFAGVGGVYYYTMNMLWAGNEDLIKEMDDLDNAFSSEGKNADS